LTQRRPTALPPPAGPSAPPAPAGAPRAPTRLPSSEAKVAAPASSAAGPTRLQGEARRGLEVPIAQIQRRFSGIDIAVAEAVEALLRDTPWQTLTLTQATQWGQADQQRYGELVEQALRLSQDPLRLAAQQHLQRLHEVLADVAEAIAEQLQPGLLSRWRAGPWELLARHRAEIDQLRTALGNASHGLVTQRESLLQQHREMQALARRLQAQGLAGTWLAEVRAGGEDARVPQALLRRAGELTTLQAHVAQAQMLRERADNDLEELCGAVQHGVLVLLPAWLEKALHAGAASTPTATRELGRTLQDLLARLPGATH
jgi:hypothetical protein